ncbi:hypothetical protein IMZ08_06325 [Bacillus luteolus]|uniref:t-SNARE coiled-coil homology domain-containing protein n=1 Tax=Litchfieldia luteola TaxID=682179 RepID=A0ABR9QGQ7_9BACI|nr:hypothetical protein [Cytobacillus luteolus]MBE4907667.1 hypothetical protein [Cytobacillus luteolus]MBP1941118.1 septation ring formation regulator EzrA [Cytobacillus luteolus]
MDQELRGILQRLETGFGRLEEGQKETNNRLNQMEQKFEAKFDAVDQKFVAIDQRFDAVDQRFDAVDQRFDAVDQRFDAVDQRFDAVDQRFTGMDQRFDSVEARLGYLEKGQDELKDLFKHTTTLLTENFTSIRQDLRRNKSETDSDINLLFNRTEKHERDIAKIKQKLDI